jgi:drug/metabolite transporter (DMT)-like permease
VKSVVLFAAYFTFSLFGLFLFKANSSSLSVLVNRDGFSLRISFLAALGLIFYIGSFLLWLVIIKDRGLSLTVPFMSGVVVIATAVGGVVLFHEKLNPLQIFGIACIVGGIVLTNYTGK